MTAELVTAFRQTYRQQCRLTDDDRAQGFLTAAIAAADMVGWVGTLNAATAELLTAAREVDNFPRPNTTTGE